MLTQLTKGAADKLPFRVPTRLLSYIIALLIGILAEVFSKDPTLSDIVLCTVNSALVALAANGGYDTVHDLMSDRTEYDEKADEDDEDNP